MKFLSFFSFFIAINLCAVEISLEENRAKSGTVGYVDIKKIFDRFAPASRKFFNDELKKRQNEVDQLKKELFEIRARREKLMWEYEIAKMYEEFVGKMSSLAALQPAQMSVDNEGISSTSVRIGYDTAVSTDPTNNIVIESTNTKSAGLQNSSSTHNEEPFVVMPGIGKIPISLFKFSLSSSPAVIDAEIVFLTKKSEEIEKKIYDLKERYDEEMSKIAQKENVEIFKKIYQAIEETAKKEGISIVVDKRNILFGIKNIDLTEKVIERMEKE